MERVRDARSSGPHSESLGKFSGESRKPLTCAYAVIGSVPAQHLHRLFDEAMPEAAVHSAADAATRTQASGTFGPLR